MNTEIRDHLNFAKGALDLLTNSTTADTGVTMLLDIHRDAAVDVLRSRVTADTVPRLAITSSGVIAFSTGAAATDTRISRHADAGRTLFDTNGTANPTHLSISATAAQRSLLSIRVADEANPRFRAYGDATLQGIELGTGGADAPDVNLYRSGANQLKTDDTLIVSHAGGVVSNDTVFAFRAGLTGDANYKMRISEAGVIEWGVGGATAVDTTLYRAAADILRTNDLLSARRGAAANGALDIAVDADAVGRLSILATGAMWWSDGAAAADTSFYRLSADNLASDDNFRVVGPNATTARGYHMHVSGEANNRISLYMDSGGLPTFRMGPGGATATVQVLGPRQTGHATWTGTAEIVTRDTETVTLIQLARAVKGMKDGIAIHGFFTA